MAIDWSSGYSCAWHAYEVRLDTWADGSEIGAVESASVERSCDGDAPLLESGSIEVTSPIGTDWNERYIRLVMVADQEGEKERVEVCTLLCSSASGSISHGIDVLRVTGRSVLYPASVALISAGSYAPAGADGAVIAARLLRNVIAAPVSIDGSFKLASHVVYDLGESILSVVWNLLSAGGFGIRISGDGTVHIGPIPTKASLQLDQNNMRLVHADKGVAHELDLSDVPNRYIAIEGLETAEVVNNDKSSITSTVSRGYRHDVIDNSPVRIDGETLTAYCSRKLEELSTIYDTRDWSREWWPDVFPGDMVHAALTSVDLEGDYRIIKQSLTCGLGVTVSEQARREVRLWQRR